MTHPLISIIVPIYNVELYLDRCLQSIVSQTILDLEIICVNDGSTDNSPLLLSQWAQKDSRIHVINQPNAGLSAARNAGLRIAVGKYIGFVDSDDWIHAGYFEHLLQTAQSMQAEVVQTDCQHISSIDQAKEVVYQDAVRVTQLLEKLRRVSAWQTIYRRDFLQQHRFTFPEGLKWEDVLWTLQVMHYAPTVVHLQANAYYYFSNPRGICSLAITEKKEEIRHDILEIIARCIQFAKEKNFSSLQMAQTKQQLANLFAIMLQSVDFPKEQLRQLRLLLGPWLFFKMRYGRPFQGSLCWVEKTEFHGQRYHVLRILRLKIRLWKVK